MMQDLLGRLRDDSLPSSRVDIGRAIRTARRQRRGRWALGGLTVVTLLVGGGAFVAANSYRGQGGATEFAASQQGWDPMRRWIQVADVAGLRPGVRVTARYWQTYELWQESKGSPRVTVTAYYPGGQPVISSQANAAPQRFDPATGESAGKIRGAAAYWSSGFEQQDAVQLLAWQWADNAWVLVGVNNGEASFDVAAFRDLARRVATAVTVAEGPVVAMPFTIKPTSGTRLISTRVSFPSDRRDNDQVWAQLDFGKVDNLTPQLLQPDDHSCIINAHTMDVLGNKGPATQQINGHPAQITAHMVRIYQADGFTVEVTGSQALPVAKSVQILPGAAQSEHAWTAQPF